VYGRQRGDEGTKFSEHQIFAQWFPDRSNRDQSTPFCNNANAAIRRSLWERIPYDEQLTGLEDLDWAKRALAERYRIAYAAEAEIVHVHNETYASIFNRYRREALALKRIIPEERFTLRDFLRLITANAWHDIRQARRAELLPGELFPIIAFRTMQFWGTYIGFSQTGPLTNRLKQRFYYPGNWRPAPPATAHADMTRRIDYSLHLDGKA
jgi:GT2 family glycosyltransferase